MKLRRVLSTALAGTSLAACCLRDSWWESESYEMPPTAEGMLGELVAKCRADDDCEALCTYHWVYLSTNNPEGDSDTRDCKRDGDTLTYEGYATCVAGRRPMGFRVAPREGHVVGAYLAMQAALEAASVRAFADLHADLVAHGAPRALRDRAIAAAADEVRHAAVCAELARRYGARVAVTPIAPAARRSLYALAIDNAVEGCVRETFGAAVAAYQSLAAGDPAIRMAMASIARDEARHAELAWDTHRWLAPQLSAAEWSALVAAAAEERGRLVVAPAAVLVAACGLPDERVQRALLA